MLPTLRVLMRFSGQKFKASVCFGCVVRNGQYWPEVAAATDSADIAALRNVASPLNLSASATSAEKPVASHRPDYPLT